jgi:hypothetical protein
LPSNRRPQNGDHLAAKELREWVEIRKENEERTSDKRLLELPNPITRTSSWLSYTRRPGRETMGGA